MNKVLATLAILAGCVVVVGCGEGGPRLVPAKGTVTMGGQPVAGANVGVFYPDNTSASGITDNNGVFTLVYNGKPGAQPGTGLKVSVTKQEHAYQMEGVDPNNPDPSKMDPKMMIEFGKKMGGQGKGPSIPKKLLPAKYGDPAQSGITIDIPAGGKEDIKIELSAS